MILFLLHSDLLICKAARIPLITNRISPIAYKRYLLKLPARTERVASGGFSESSRLRLRLEKLINGY
ncbi:MAG: hypothetical protein HKP49_07985 [Maribacter sp.]|nr:hypothetical protein [Maribacter sp.]